MHVERQLQIGMAALAALGTLLLGMGQQSAWLPLLAAVAVIVSVYVTDIARLFQLNRHLANAAAVGALLISLREFLNSKPQEQLLVIANLLIYLQIVLVFQKKNDRVYWLLAVLSLLQVVVAAALNMGFLFGVLLIVYLVVALTALFLFFLHRETRLYRESEEDEPIVVEAPAGDAGGLWTWLAYLGVPDAGDDEPPPAEEPFAQSVVYRERDHGPALRVLPGWSMVREVTGLTLATLVFTGVIFYSVPRFEDASWRWGGGSQRTETGFSAEISLIDQEQLSQSDDIALRVSWTDLQSGDPVATNGEFYLRGAVANEYRFARDQGAGHYQWVHSSGTDARSEHLLRRGGITLPAPVPGVALIRQEIVLATSANSTLFSAFPLFQTATPDERVRYESRSEQLYYHLRQTPEERPRRVQFRYLAAVGGFDGGVQREVTPRALYPIPGPVLFLGDRRTRSTAAITPPLGEATPLDLGQRGELLRHDDARLSGLKAFARDLVKDLPPEDAYRRAKHLENYFRLSGKFTYALNLDTVPRRQELDPNEDFVLHHRTGNCRHFASALALMLRGLGIPARLVSGYKGGEYNSVGSYYVVRQKHAHAWVEAYLEPEQIPPHTLERPELAAGGAWLRLDPTPLDEEGVGFLGEITWLDHLGEMADYVQMLWNDYVVHLNRERQNEAIFEPLVDSSLQTAENVTSPSAWQSFFARLAERLGLARDGWLARYWYLWLVGLGLPLAAGLAWGVWRYGPDLWRMLFAGGSGLSAGRRRGESVDFYLQLEDLLARHGHPRGPAQTAREWAVLVGAELVAAPRGREAAAHLRQLVDRFYLLRYGGQPLTPAERADIAGRLRDLEQWLAAPPPAPAPA